MPARAALGRRFGSTAVEVKLMGVTRRGRDLVSEARDLLVLLEPENVALVRAALAALADKAGQTGDRYAQATIQSMLQSSLCDRSAIAGGN